MKRRVIITGGGTGIGRALAIELAKRGDDVLACGRRAELMDELTHATGIHTISCDITLTDDRLRLLEQAQRLFGGLDVLINNAGVQEPQVYGNGTIDRAALKSEILTNLTAPMLLVDEALPLLLKETASAVVNVVSLLAVMPKPTAPGYCASKAGLLGFTRALRMQLADKPIKIIDVFPPLVDTPMTVGRGTAKMSAERCAAALADGLDAGRETIAIGEASKVLLFSRWFPSMAERAIRQMTRPISAAAVGT